MSFLCIAIPTYNRAQHLFNRLSELKKQLQPGVCIHVFDNHSTDNTEEIASQFLCPEIKYSKNNANLGMCGNFIRCFTTPQSEWLWILGDDDPVQPNALERIIKILKATNSLFVNFNTNCCYNPENRCIVSFDELLDTKDATSLMHISSNFYRISRLKETFKILVPSAFTFAPNVVIIYHAMQTIQGCSIDLIKDEFLYDGKNPRRWSCLEVSVGLSAFPWFIQQNSLRKKCALQLRTSTRWMLLWALGEVKDKDDLIRWKRVLAYVNTCFGNFGATFFAALFYNLKVSRKDFIREFFLQIARLSPKHIVYYLSNKLKKRTLARRDDLLTDFR